MTYLIWIVISLVTLVFYILFYRKIVKLQKGNKVPLFMGVSWLVFAGAAGIIFGMTISAVLKQNAPDGLITELTCKQYVIDYSYELSESNQYISTVDSCWKGSYKIDTCLLPYWDDITVSNYGDSAYIIFWGDRDSWMWKIRSDKAFMIYRPSKGNSLVYDNGEYIMQTPDEQDANIFYILDNLKENK